jgi:type I restriction enzyme R subunit
VLDDLEELLAGNWKDASAIRTAITEKIPKLLAADQAYQHVQEHSDPENIRVEAELAVQRAISAILSDYIELFQQFAQNPNFRNRLARIATSGGTHRE